MYSIYLKFMLHWRVGRARVAPPDQLSRSTSPILPPTTPDQSKKLTFAHRAV